MNGRRTCPVCGRPRHGPDDPIPREEYPEHGLLRTDFANRPAYDPEELRVALLSEEEYDAIIEREYAEAEAHAAARRKGSE